MYRRLVLLCASVAGAFGQASSAVNSCRLYSQPANASPQATPQQAMDFEIDGVWRTEADLLQSFSEKDLSSTAAGFPFSTLAGGLRLSTDHVKSGQFSGKWENHSYYPTLATSCVEKDWSHYSFLSLWIYSEVKTDEHVTLAIHSDSKQTRWTDFFYTSFTVDWTGWKELRFLFDDFQSYGTPAGWQKVDGIYFYTKAFGYQPNPYTVLYIDALHLGTRPLFPSPARSNPAHGTAPHVSPTAASLTIIEDSPLCDWGRINHPFPETSSGAVVKSPIQQQPYFKAERAANGYYPRFCPALPSVDRNGNSYLKYGSYKVQTITGDGSWSVVDLWPQVEAYIQHTLRWTNVHLMSSGYSDDPVLRFDNDGGAYALVEAYTDLPSSARLPVGLLMYSPDGLQTWQLYRLPVPFGRFERVDTHNPDSMNGPPVILLDNDWSNPADQGGYLLIPETRTDGTLALPPPVKIANSCIPFNEHSGGANVAVSDGNKVFIVYGVLDASKTPPLPASHPAFALQYVWNRQVVYSRAGVPAFIVAYDRQSRSVSSPVFLGFGGHAIDGHNWPGLAIDSLGFLHVVINGHHDPVYYVKSAEPHSISQWGAPELVGANLSYASLNLDANDTIYMVNRKSTRGYYFDLTLSRKRAGRPWQTDLPIVRPFKAFYWNWFNNVSIAPASGRLFLSYYSQSDQIQVFKDEYDAYLFIWPDLEKGMLAQHTGAVVLPTGTSRIPGSQYQTYVVFPPSQEPTVLVSDDEGTTWRLATTTDFTSPSPLRGGVPAYGQVGRPHAGVVGAK